MNRQTHYNPVTSDDLSFDASNYDGVRSDSNISKVQSKTSGVTPFPRSKFSAEQQASIKIMSDDYNSKLNEDGLLEEDSQQTFEFQFRGLQEPKKQKYSASVKERGF